MCPAKLQGFVQKEGEQGYWDSEDVDKMKEALKGFKG